MNAAKTGLVLSRFVLIILCLGGSTSFGLVQECRQIFAPAFQKVPAKAAGSFRLLAYNVENLIHASARSKTGQTFRDKSKSDTQEIVNLTQKANPDVVVWAEVQDLAIMKETQDRFGMRDYKPYALPGNDHFGIGMWVKKDLKLTATYETHKDVMWNDPMQGGKQVKLFSRDVPALILIKAGEVKPFLIVLGIHAKSKRDREGDPQSSILRTAQFQGEENIIKEYEARYGADVPLVAMGDHNTDIRTSAELGPLRDELIDGFAAAPDSIAEKDRVTHSFFPRGGNPEYLQLDGIMVNRSSNLKPVLARVVPYLDEKGQPEGLPKSFEERKKQPSDHFAIILDLAS